MLLALAIRDLVLIENLSLVFAGGLTVLTGETGAGKSIILDALGLAIGARADPALVRRAADRASVTAIFSLGADHAAWKVLDEKGIEFARNEDLVLRRTVAADGRSRAFVNDQAVGAAMLRDLGQMLVEIHGQHETFGLLDSRNHRGFLDAFADNAGELATCAGAWRSWRSAAADLLERESERTRAEHERDGLAELAAQLDRLAPREGEEASLADERRLLGAAEKTLGDLTTARDHLAGEEIAGRLGQALRAVERACERNGSVANEGGPLRLLENAREALERASIEAAEAGAALDGAAAAFNFEPDRLERTEERLFALRAVARRLGIAVADLPRERARINERLLWMEDLEADVSLARAAAAKGRDDYDAAASAVSAFRRAAAERLTRAVQHELAPLKLGKTSFRVTVDADAEERAGPSGRDRVEFQIATIAGAPYGSLGVIASGGELARLALAIKACLAARRVLDPPALIFDEVDQGVGGAVADAVGARLKLLAAGAQVLVVTHSPQVAARADVHWRVGRSGDGAGERTNVEALDDAAREEELARMLSGARISDAARAAARALMHA